MPYAEVLRDFKRPQYRHIYQSIYLEACRTGRWQQGSKPSCGFQGYHQDPASNPARRTDRNGIHFRFHGKHNCCSSTKLLGRSDHVELYQEGSRLHMRPQSSHYHLKIKRCLI